MKNPFLFKVLQAFWKISKIWALPKKCRKLSNWTVPTLTEKTMTEPGLAFFDKLTVYVVGEQEWVITKLWSSPYHTLYCLLQRLVVYFKYFQINRWNRSVLFCICRDFPEPFSESSSMQSSLIWIVCLRRRIRVWTINATFSVLCSENAGVSFAFALHFSETGSPKPQVNVTLNHVS